MQRRPFRHANRRIYWLLLPILLSLACNLPLGPVQPDSEGEPFQNNIAEVAALSVEDGAVPSVEAAIRPNVTPVSAPQFIDPIIANYQDLIAYAQRPPTPTPRPTPTLEEPATFTPAPPVPEWVDWDQPLAPTWPNTIQQWSGLIERNAKRFGLHPDLIAAVVMAESNGLAVSGSQVGAVGLMGIMSYETGFTNRPNREDLFKPEVNIAWGCSILAEILGQSGGDVHAALAAYNGGWRQVNDPIPQGYATAVLDNFGRALVAREGINPDLIEQWSVAIDVLHGNIAGEELILAYPPAPGAQYFGEVVIYNGPDFFGRNLFIRGYAVPIIFDIPDQRPSDTWSNN